MSDALEVWFEGQPSGILRAADGGGLIFRYHRDWLEHPRRRALSLSLPLSAEPVVRGAATSFFRRLLPDEPLRSQIADKLELAPGDDFALLSALAGECAGAVSLQPLGVDPGTLRQDYVPLTSADLSALTRSGARLPLLTGRTRSTLSGAGAKLPVFVRDGSFFLTVGPAPTSHILKLGAPEHAHLPANQAFTTRFAQELGLEVAEVALWPTEGEPALLCRRFDRSPGRNGTLRRLHQEDFAQAFGPRPPDEQSSLREAIELVRRHARAPLHDTLRLIVWAVFHLIAGDSGADPHNLAFLYDEAGPPRLGPFFDLVCTRAYRKLDRHLVMSIGGERDPVSISRNHWIALSRGLGIKEKTIIEIVEKTLDAAEPALDRAQEHFLERHGEHDILRLVPVMRGQIAWVRDKLGQRQ